MSKIFCIGLNKTGTTSLHEALRILGFKSLHSMKRVNQSLKNGLLLKDLTEKYDAILDGWISRYYKELDKKYPNAKFILTVRNYNDWLKSRIRHNKIMGKESRNRYKDKWEDEYRQHYMGVVDYFAGQDKILIFDICGGEGWAKLCHFLDKPIPAVQFPHKNKSK